MSGVYPQSWPGLPTFNSNLWGDRQRHNVIAYVHASHAPEEKQRKISLFEKINLPPFCVHRLVLSVSDLFQSSFKLLAIATACRDKAARLIEAQDVHCAAHAGEDGIGKSRVGRGGPSLAPACVAPWRTQRSVRLWLQAASARAPINEACSNDVRDMGLGGIGGARCPKAFAFTQELAALTTIPLPEALLSAMKVKGVGIAHALQLLRMVVYVQREWPIAVEQLLICVVRSPGFITVRAKLGGEQAEDQLGSTALQCTVAAFALTQPPPLTPA